MSARFSPRTSSASRLRSESLPSCERHCWRRRGASSGHRLPWRRRTCWLALRIWQQGAGMGGPQFQIGIFAERRKTLLEAAGRIKRTSAAVAETDLLACFAHLAAGRRYVRPTISDEQVIEAVAARHPVIEQWMRSEERRVGKECRSRWLP